MSAEPPAQYPSAELGNRNRQFAPNAALDPGGIVILGNIGNAAANGKAVQDGGARDRSPPLFELDEPGLVARGGSPAQSLITKLDGQLNGTPIERRIRAQR